MLHRFILPLVSWCVLWAAGPSLSATLTLTPTADTRILNFTQNNVQNDDLLSVFNSPGNTQRTLMKFDLSGIPANQQIISATLTLTAQTNFGSNPNNLSMDVHAVTRPWLESQAAWNFATFGTPWTTAGGDFNPFIYASSNVNPSNFTPITWNLTSLVEDWYDGSIANEGLLLQSATGNFLTFTSTNPPNPTRSWPSLAIEFTPIPEASSLLMLGVAGSSVLWMLRKRSRSTT